MIKTNDRPTFRNPILAGFYPDPSVCAVGDDFYLVCSTFSYFPGIPVFHSRDLVNWQQIGHVLERPSQLPLSGSDHSQGIFAPSIRYHAGTFYLACTNMSDKGNFICTASNPAGPWSDPVWLPDAPGIDPTVYFDPDGRAWYLGTRPAPEGPKYNGNWEVWIQELELPSLRLKGPSFGLWRGALRDAIWPEGPHIYWIDGYFYLLIAEAGTGQDHAVSIARSKNLTGPYEGCPHNPILTNRHLGLNHPIVNVGHADLLRLATGEWWMVLLASRPYGGYFRNLGRETFLCPVIWEEGWPIASPDSGRLEIEYPRPGLESHPFPALPACDHFDAAKPALQWMELRNPEAGAVRLDRRPGWLSLATRSPGITDKSNPSCLLRRQTSPNFATRCRMDFTAKVDSESAGMVLMQNENWLFRIEVVQKSGVRTVQAVSRADGKETILGQAAVKNSLLYLRVEARGQDFRFDYATQAEQWQLLAEKADGRILSTDLVGGFVGACLGMFASANGGQSDNYADFDWFEYQNL